jgi:chromosome partitioning protein
MKVITVAAPKGGSGKTSSVTALAVRACQESTRVGLVDLNADQGNLTQWWIARGEPMNPRLFPDPENLVQDIALLRTDGWDWCFVDTPPIDMDLIETAVVVADAVVVPVRCSVFDFGAIEPIVEMCKQRRKPFAFLLSAVDSRFKALASETVASLVDFGPVFATRISYRLPYINALTMGRTGPELEKELKPEIDALWSEVRRLAQSSKSQPAGRGRVNV